MLDWQELKGRRDILDNIDWDITPQEAFQAYQLKSVDNWRQRSLGEVHYFYLSDWAGRNRVVLVKRTYVDSEELCEPPVPPEMLADCLKRQEGQDMPHGQYPLCPEIAAWLKAELDL